MSYEEWVLAIKEEVEDFGWNGSRTAKDEQEFEKIMKRMKKVLDDLEHLNHKINNRKRRR